MSVDILAAEKARAKAVAEGILANGGLVSAEGVQNLIKSLNNSTGGKYNYKITDNNLLYINNKNISNHINHNFYLRRVMFTDTHFQDSLIELFVNIHHEDSDNYLALMAFVRIFSENYINKLNNLNNIGGPRPKDAGSRKDPKDMYPHDHDEGGGAEEEPLPSKFSKKDGDKGGGKPIVENKGVGEKGTEKEKEKGGEMGGKGIGGKKKEGEKLELYVRKWLAEPEILHKKQPGFMFPTYRKYSNEKEYRDDSHSWRNFLVSVEIKGGKPRPAWGWRDTGGGFAAAEGAWFDKRHELYLEQYGSKEKEEREREEIEIKRKKAESEKLEKEKREKEEKNKKEEKEKKEKEAKEKAEKKVEEEKIKEKGRIEKEIKKKEEEKREEILKREKQDREKYEKERRDKEVEVEKTKEKEKELEAAKTREQEGVFRETLEVLERQEEELEKFRRSQLELTRQLKLGEKERADLREQLKAAAAVSQEIVVVREEVVMLDPTEGEMAIARLAEIERLLKGAESEKRRLRAEIERMRGENLELSQKYNVEKKDREKLKELEWKIEEIDKGKIVVEGEVKNKLEKEIKIIRSRTPEKPKKKEWFWQTFATGRGDITDIKFPQEIYVNAEGYAKKALSVLKNFNNKEKFLEIPFKGRGRMIELVWYMAKDKEAWRLGNELAGNIRYSWTVSQPFEWGEEKWIDWVVEMFRRVFVGLILVIAEEDLAAGMIVKQKMGEWGRAWIVKLKEEFAVRSRTWGSVVVEKRERDKGGRSLLDGRIRGALLPVVNFTIRWKPWNGKIREMLEEEIGEVSWLDAGKRWVVLNRDLGLTFSRKEIGEIARGLRGGLTKNSKDRLLYYEYMIDEMEEIVDEKGEIKLRYVMTAATELGVVVLKEAMQSQGGTVWKAEDINQWIGQRGGPLHKMEIEKREALVTQYQVETRERMKPMTRDRNWISLFGILSFKFMDSMIDRFVSAWGDGSKPADIKCTWHKIWALLGWRQNFESDFLYIFATYCVEVLQSDEKAVVVALIAKRLELFIIDPDGKDMVE